MSKSKNLQVTVSLSGELVDIFNELKKKQLLTIDAEVFRIALKHYYYYWKAERMVLEKNRQELEKYLKGYGYDLIKKIGEEYDK